MKFKVNRVQCWMIVVFLSLGACGKLKSTSSPQSSPNPPSPATPEPPSHFTDQPQVLVGWLQEYDTHIHSEIQAQETELLQLSADEMATVCPKWSDLSTVQKLNFWSSLLYAVAKEESDFERNMIYLETGLSTDPITKQQIRSEGLLQLSYGDVEVYHYPFDDISWERDSTSALHDYEIGTKKGDATRTLLNAYSNLNLGLWIMRDLLKKRPAELFESATCRYWSTLRPNSTPFGKILDTLGEKIPACGYPLKQIH